MQSTKLLLPAITATLFAACAERQADDSPVAVDDAPAAAVAEPAAMAHTPSAPGARVFFIMPADGDTVSNPVRIEFGIEGMSVVKAGDDTAASGHHHLIIDAGLPDLGLPIPADDHYVHFGDGSTSTERSLEPGTHTLQLLLGDHLHVPHDPPVASEVITITVE
jgi:hypothetical protein